MPKKHVTVRVPIGDAKMFNRVLKQKEKAGYQLEFAYKETLGFVYIGPKAIKKRLPPETEAELMSI